MTLRVCLGATPARAGASLTHAALVTAFFVCSACNVDSLLSNGNGTHQSFAAGGSETDRVVGITQEHNKVRAATSASPPIPDLAWSEDLASVALNYAEHLSTSCALVHSGGSYGENLAFFGGQPATATEVVDLWASEKNCYTFGPFKQGDHCSSACDSAGGCGHYTQIVWRTTKVVGCGVATCASGDAEIWVCNYDPAGNFIGEVPY